MALIRSRFVGMIGGISVGNFRSKQKYEEFTASLKKKTHRLVHREIPIIGQNGKTKEVVEWRTGKKNNKKRVDKIQMVVVEKKIRNG